MTARQKCPKVKEFQSRFTPEYCEFINFKFNQLVEKFSKGWYPSESFDHVYEHVFNSPLLANIPKKRGRKPKRSKTSKASGKSTKASPLLKISPPLKTPPSSSLKSSHPLIVSLSKGVKSPKPRLLNSSRIRPTISISMAPAEFTENVVPYRLVADRHKLRRLTKSRDRWRGLFMKRTIRTVPSRPHRRRFLLNTINQKQLNKQ